MFEFNFYKIKSRHNKYTKRSQETDCGCMVATANLKCN